MKCNNKFSNNNNNNNNKAVTKATTTNKKDRETERAVLCVYECNVK